MERYVVILFISETFLFTTGCTEVQHFDISDFTHDGGEMLDTGTMTTGGERLSCADIICDNPPPNSCADEGRAKIYDPLGYCSDDVCSYEFHIDPCESGVCKDGMCTSKGTSTEDEDLCKGKICTTPPAAFCLDGKWVSYEDTGVCQADGDCHYERNVTICSNRCDAFGCLTDTDTSTETVSDTETHDTDDDKDKDSPKDCTKDPLPPKNGVVLGAGIKANAIRYFSCLKGYALEGDAYTTCEPDTGTWSTTQTTCEKITSACQYSSVSDEFVVYSELNISTDYCAGTGRSEPEGVSFPVASAVSEGSKLVSLCSAPEGLAAGDEVLIINLQGNVDDADSDVGQWEIKTVSKVSGTNVHFTEALEHAYNGTIRKIVVQRIPVFSSLVVHRNGLLTADGWDGEKGGVLAFRVESKLEVSGRISMYGKGYRPNPTRSSNSSNFSPRVCQTGFASCRGESYNGMSDSLSHQPFGGAGGGGRMHDGTDIANANTGGGGASYGTRGTGGAVHCSSCSKNDTRPVDYSKPGLTYGVADLKKRIYLGSAGGNGGHNTNSACEEDLQRWGGIAGAGGGIIIVFGDEIIVKKGGIIDSQGGRGDGQVKLGRSGGGGAGGSILLSAADEVVINGYILAEGAYTAVTTTDAYSWGCTDDCYIRGKGGDGRIALEAVGVLNIDRVFPAPYLGGVTVPYKWLGDFSACNADCKDGISTIAGTRTRTLFCTNSLTVNSVDDSYCPGSKPPLSEACGCKTCKEILDAGKAVEDGVYATDRGPALCDMSRAGGGWTLALSGGYISPADSSDIPLWRTSLDIGDIADALAGYPARYKLSDEDARSLSSATDNFDLMADQTGYHPSFSSGNFEYVVIDNYTGFWRFDAPMAGSSTTTVFRSYSTATDAVAWEGNLECGLWNEVPKKDGSPYIGPGIYCTAVAKDSVNPAGGAGCETDYGADTSSDLHHFVMHRDNSDSVITLCNGWQFSSGGFNHRYWLRER